MSNAISTCISEWLQGGTVRVLGWTLVHFLWEGLALGLLLFALIASCRRAQTRYALGVCTLGAMLVAPFLTFAVLSQGSQAAAPALVDDSIRHLHAIASAPPVASAPAELILHAPLLPENFPAWCTCAWLIGVLLFSLRTIGGWLVLARLRRECTRSLPPEFVQNFRLLEQRLLLTKPVRYLQSKLVETPSVVGWLRPVVLLPIGALTGLSRQQLEAVIVHELAHIRRLDGVVNLFQIAAENLFFYHPAVWWVNKLVRKERENCCDDVSVEICGNAVEYARALTILESARVTPAWALSASGGDLKARVLRLVSPERTAAAVSTSGLGLLGVLCMTGALLTAAAIGKAGAGPIHLHGIGLQAGAAPSALVPLPDDNGVSPHSDPHPERPMPAARPASIAAGREIAQATPAPNPEPSQSASPGQSASSYIEGLKAAGLKDLTADELVAFKIQGVSPEYIAQIRRTGLSPDVHEWIGMKVQGITPDYVREVRSTGLNPSVRDLIGMKVQGISPAYVHDMQNAGLGELKVRDLIGMKVQGINPAYVHEVQNSGLGQVAVHDVIAMKVQSVTPEYVRAIRATGLNPTLHDLIGMKVQGVTPEYVRALQAAGLGSIKAHDCISAKAQGVTPEFIEKVKSHGFRNLTLHQLIALKSANVF